MSCVTALAAAISGSAGAGAPAGPSAHAAKRRGTIAAGRYRVRLYCRKGDRTYWGERV